VRNRQAERGQSAGEVFENSTPASPRQSSRPQAAPPSPEATDADAQVFADKAAQARIPAEIEAIHREAREKGKVAALIRNPAGGGVGKLAVYLDWKRKQLMAAAPDGGKAAGSYGLDPDDDWADKVADITRPEHADPVIAEAQDLLGKEAMTPEHYAQISTAVEARLADIAVAERTAA